MMRTALLSMSLIFIGANPTWALEKGSNAGVGGRQLPTTISSQTGGSNQTIGSTGPSPIKTGGSGSVIVTSGGLNTSTAIPTIGIPVVVKGGVGGNTLDSVPGKAPTYMKNVGGRNSTFTSGGGIGP